MRNRSNNSTTEVWKRKDRLCMGWGMFALGAFLGVVITLVVVLFTCPAYADEMTVICNPESYVNIREKPKMSGTYAGRLELGDTVETDGKRKNGFLHVINVSNEAGEGWVYAAYLTDEELWVDTIGATVAKNNVRLRRTPGGEVIRMLRKGERLTVLAWAGLWAVTDHGFVQVEFLECDR